MTESTSKNMKVKLTKKFIYTYCGFLIILVSSPTIRQIKKVIWQII